MAVISGLMAEWKYMEGRTRSQATEHDVGLEETHTGCSTLALPGIFPSVNRVLLYPHSLTLVKLKDGTVCLIVAPKDRSPGTCDWDLIWKRDSLQV